MKWQPIETAPRDGTWVLLGRPDEPIDDKSYYMGAVSIATWFPADDDFEEGWYMSEGNEFVGATHWMPLPKPPERVE